MPHTPLFFPCRYDMPDSVARGTDYCNYFFTMYFFVEMITKVTGLGPHLYVSDNFNIFDALVTIAGVVEMALALAPNVESSSAMSVFRAFRLLRIFRLARSWKSLNRIINVLLVSLLSVSWLTVLLFLFIFIGGLLGMTVRPIPADYSLTHDVTASFSAVLWLQAGLLHCPWSDPALPAWLDV